MGELAIVDIPLADNSLEKADKTERIKWRIVTQILRDLNSGTSNLAVKISFGWLDTWCDMFVQLLVTCHSCSLLLHVLSYRITSIKT